jgi:hypothetical protein
MGKNKPHRNAGLSILAVLCGASGASFFTGCAVDSSQPDVAQQDGESSRAQSQKALNHPPLEDTATATFGIDFPWMDSPHICDLGFLGGAVCDQYCKSQRHAWCGYCMWNDSERRLQCQCQSDPNACSR